MNQHLLETILRHVYSNLLIIPSEFIDVNNSASILSTKFLLEDNLWGCKVSSGDEELIIMVNSYEDEHSLLVKLKDSPIYCSYLFNSEEYDSEAMLACTLDGNSWLPCNTFLQATFLAGMEQMREIGLTWNKIKDYKEEKKLINSFIKFHHSIYEEDNEGSES